MKKSFADKIRDWFSKIGYTCDACGMEVFDYPKARLCEACESSLYKNEQKRCGKCGRASVADGLCLSCKKKTPAFTKGLSPFVYENLTAILINRFKNGERHLAYFFAERMAKILQTQNLEKENALIVAVPLTEERELERGYNQAEELSKIVGERLNVTFDRETLVKTRETGAQKKLSGTERQENVKGAYHVRKRKAVNGKTVVLIDDIMTTGSTGSECARVLKNAGAKEVIFLTAVSLKEIKQVK